MWAMMVMMMAISAVAGSSSSLECLSWWRWDDAEGCRQRSCRIEDVVNCVYPTPNTVALKRLHVVQGCHFDAGFVAPDPMIINRWWHEFFPLAFQVGKELDAMNNASSTAGPRLHFTAQSWLVAMFLNCPSEYEKHGVVCPTAAEIEQFHQAVRHGYITWHAFPFNGESEVFDPSLFSFGFELTHRVDDMFGLPRKRVMSQRDVPGLTKAAIPIMLRNGVNSISVGSNGGSAPVNVPKSFIWKFNDTLSVRAFWLGGGYGGFPSLPHPFSITQIPGAEDAMVVLWRGDNSGPPEVSEVLSNWETLQRSWPGVEIVASTFEKFVQAVASVPDANFPVIEAEIGDTWIYGVASDPVKMQEFRILSSLRSECLDAGVCSLADERVFNFSVLALKSGEHTWGRDQKTVLPLYVDSNWTNADFERLKDTTQFLNMSGSWVQQRQMGINDAIEALRDHPLAGQIEAALAEARQPVWMNTTGWKPLVAGATLGIGNHSLVFDANGVLTSMDGIVGRLGFLTYSLYDQKDYDKFEHAYNFWWPERLADKYDFDKVNLPGGVTHQDVALEFVDGFVGPDAVVVRMQTPPALKLVELAGACPIYTVLYQVVPSISASGVVVSVILANKTSTRLPESTSFGFQLGPSRCEARMKKLGGVRMDPSTVQDGGSRHLHCVEEVYCSEGQAFVVRPVDAPLVSFGSPNAFPTPIDQGPESLDEFHFVCHNNLWNTNYPVWFPYTQGQDVQLRFVLNTT